MDRREQTINSYVPLLIHEQGHHWKRTRLHGCEICGTHEGVECLNCRRVVDAVMSPGLYLIILALDAWPEVAGENDS
jgi:hypothetical protein